LQPESGRDASFARQLPIVLSEAVLIIVIEGLGISATPKIDYEYDYEHEKANCRAKPGVRLTAVHCARLGRS
jgi:hypothetical protein